MKLDTPHNILISYAYMNSAAFCQEVAQAVNEGRMNLMLDSGAFTKFNAKNTGQHVTLDNYCNFLEKMGPYAEKYVMLDKIGNAEGSRANYEEMVRRGLAPMFVATMYDTDYAYISDTLKLNRNICVAGGATTKGEWMVKRFQDVYRKTGEKARIHGLAFVDFPKMYQVPIASVDSSTWITSSQKFGNVFIFEGRSGIHFYYYGDHLKGGHKLPDSLKRELNMMKVTPTMYANPDNHRGAFSINVFSAIVAYTKFQMYSKKNDRDLFLAVGNVQQLRNVLWVYDHFNELSYEQWKAECNVKKK